MPYLALLSPYVVFHNRSKIDHLCAGSRRVTSTKESCWSHFAIIMTSNQKSTRSLPNKKHDMRCIRGLKLQAIKSISFFIHLGKCYILTFLSNVAIRFLKVTGLPSTVFGYVELSIWTSHPRLVIEFAMCCFKMYFNHSVNIYT